MDTPTNTRFEDHMCGASEAMPTLAREIIRSMMGRAALLSTRPRTATALSHLSHDTRFEYLHAPYTGPLGEGHDEGGH